MIFWDILRLSMAKRTHRWMPTMYIKMSGPHKRANTAEFTTNILRRAREMLHDPCGYVHPKFENSLYFDRNRTIVMTEPETEMKNKEVRISEKYSKKTIKNHINFQKVGSSDSWESVQKDFIQNDTIRLERSETVILAHASDFYKSMDLGAMCYVISNEKQHIDKFAEVLEYLKKNIKAEDWGTFRIILFDESLNVRNSLLSKNVIELDFKRNVSEESSLSKVSSSTLNSHLSSNEADNKLKKRSIQMYRDSCIIAHKRLPPEDDNDPIGKCFENITKLVQDEIFSIHKHVKDHVEELNQLISINGYDQFNYSPSF